MNTICTTVRLPPKTVATLIEGLRLTSPCYNRFRTNAEVIITACDVLSEMLTQRYPELSKLSETKIATTLLSCNALGNVTVKAAASRLLMDAQDESEYEEILGETPEEPLGETLGETVCETVCKKPIAPFKIPENFISGEL